MAFIEFITVVSVRVGRLREQLLERRFNILIYTVERVKFGAFNPFDQVYANICDRLHGSQLQNHVSKRRLDALFALSAVAFDFVSSIAPARSLNDLRIVTHFKPLELHSFKLVPVWRGFCGF